MRRKFLFFSLIFLVILNLTACNSNDKHNDNNVIDEKKDNIGSNNDANKFKNDYESLNDVENEANGKKFRSINIPEDNPMVYKEASDIIDMINNKESFVVYFGFTRCPWCRSIVSTLIEVANDYNVEAIYYVDISEIRDTLKLDDNNKVVIDKEGTKDYQKLIKLLDNVLDNYTLADSVGNSVETGEKRIYAPNIIAIVEGQAVGITTGISDSQKDGYQQLTSDMLDDSYEKLANVIKLLNQNNECSTDSKC